MKNFFVNLFYFIQINCILFLCHIWALFGIAFNDTGVQFNNVFEAWDIILFGIMPLTIGSMVLGKLYKRKEDFNCKAFYIAQTLMIIGWIILYISAYVA